LLIQLLKQINSLQGGKSAIKKRLLSTLIAAVILISGISGIGVAPAAAPPSYTVTTILEPSLEFYTVHFQNGFAMVQVGERTTGKWGFANAMGEIIVPVEYDRVRHFRDGLAAVRKNSMWGFVNTRGEVIVPIEYDEVRDFDNGLAAVRKGNMWGIINTGGDVVIPLEHGNILSSRFGSLAPSFGEDRIGVARGNKWGFICTNGEQITDFEYDHIHEFRGGFAAVAVGAQGEYLFTGKWGFINPNGEKITPLIYDWKEDFSEGFALVGTGGFQNPPYVISPHGDIHGAKWGFIDTNGEVAIALEFDYAHSFRDGIAPVAVFCDSANDVRWGAINTDGEIVAELIHHSASLFMPPPPPASNMIFRNGLIVVNLDNPQHRFGNRWSIADTNRARVIPDEYEWIMHAQCVGGTSYFWVSESNDRHGYMGTWGIIAITNNSYVPPEPPDFSGRETARTSLAEICEICGQEKLWRIMTLFEKNENGGTTTERRGAKRNSAGELLSGACF
jgi:hypothetical protein